MSFSDRALYAAACVMVLATAAAAQLFTRVEHNVVLGENVKSFACAWIDYDADGNLDLFVGNLGVQNCLYENDGKGQFRKIDAERAGSLLSTTGESFSVSWGDFNNDGLPDAFVSNFNGPLTIHKQLPGNRFELLNASQGIAGSYPAQGGSWADVDADGDLDLYVANVAQTKNLLLINSDAGRFIPLPSDATDFATNSHSAVWGDYNNDRYPDLFIAENYEGVNKFYTNDKGTLRAFPHPEQFEEKVVSTGASWVDYDNDGDLDLYVTNSLGKRNSLYRNDGNNVFTKVENLAIVTDEGNSMGASWGDFDNDGDLDLFVANSGTQNDNFYLNNGNGEFTRVEDELLTKDGKASRGCTAGDIDNDGDLDLYVTCGFGQDDRNMLYLNNSTGNNWVQLDLAGTSSNRLAIGAKVFALATIGGKTVTQLREVSSQTGAYGHNALRVHFGLKDAEEVAVEIHWPSGVKQRIGKLKSNAIHRIVEESLVKK